MIRVLFVINSPIIGGAERHTFTVSKRLADHGIEAAIFAVKAGPVAAPNKIMMLQPPGPRALPGRIRDLGNLVHDLQPDALIAVNERPMLMAFLARQLARIKTPIVVIQHSTIMRSRWERTMQIGHMPLYRRADSVVFISDNQKRYWFEQGIHPRHPTVILNGIDIERFSPSIRTARRASTRASLGFRPDEFVVGLTAVMRPEKNHVQLLETVSRLRQRGLPIKALLVGDGPQRAIIEDRARALNIQDAIVLAGSQADVRPFIAAFDVGVLCSTAVETMSLAALEIMAMGIPMVMSNIGGASEIVDGRNGSLFAVGDTNGLCDALVALADGRARAEAGAAARLTVESHFDEAAMIQSYATHLNGLVFNAHGRGERLSLSRGL